jgi:flavin reductase (DIM6/NTAB) family NADH-FMN oxidoreductase RutF
MLSTIHFQKQDIPLDPGDDSYPIFIPSVAVMISYVDAQGRANITPIVGWTVVARFPFTVAIGLCNGHYSKNYFPRYSRKAIRETREFVLNIPHVGLCEAVSLTGDVSGNDPTVDKFAISGLTPGSAKTVKAPIILECPINLECAVTDIIPVGSHDVFFARVTAIQSDPKLDEKIEDEVMMLDILRPNPTTGGLEKCRLYWKTLADIYPLPTQDPPE